jgi:ABC-type phosphate transport system substrate-binding protein
MTFLRGRRVASACVMAAALAALAPSAASAASAKKAPKGSVCDGADITGQGAAIAVGAQTLFTTQFSSVSDANPYACGGTQGEKGTPTVGYFSTSSGKGLASWGSGGSLVNDGPPATDGFSPSNAFLTTEEAPNTGQATDIEQQESSPGSVTNTVLSIPVALESINVIVNLPAGCTATSTADPGRLVLDNVTLEKIFNGTTTEWSQIKDNGDALSGASCNANTEITRVVRPESAGTTHILKQYLNLINDSALTTASGSETWAELSEGTLNTVWPTGSTPIISSATTGDNAEIKEVVATPSSIGYASLSDLRLNSSFVPPSGGAGEATFWVPIQDNGTVIKKEKYADPASNGELAAKATANCADTKFTNGKGTKFPPATVALPWDSVTTATKQKNYSLCGIVFDVALGKYSAFPATTAGEEQTVQDFVNYSLSTATGGGQTLLNGNDYEELPAKLVKESTSATEGVGLIGF